MRTLTEITDKEAAERERAWRFEKLSDEKLRLTKSIARLSAQAPDVTALEKMHALCADLPKGLTTQGSGFVAGGFIVRDMLQSIIVGALGDVQRKASATKAALAKAKTDLIEIEKLLKEFK